MLVMVQSAVYIFWEFDRYFFNQRHTQVYFSLPSYWLFISSVSSIIIYYKNAVATMATTIIDKSSSKSEKSVNADLTTCNMASYTNKLSDKVTVHQFTISCN